MFLTLHNPLKKEKDGQIQNSLLNSLFASLKIVSTLQTMSVRFYPTKRQNFIQQNIATINTKHIFWMFRNLKPFFEFDFLNGKGFSLVKQTFNVCSEY